MTRPGEVSRITGERIPTREESKERHERVVVRAAEMREKDRTLSVGNSELLAARELFPCTPRPLPQHPKGKLRTTEEQRQIQADFAKRNRG